MMMSPDVTSQRETQLSHMMAPLERNLGGLLAAFALLASVSAPSALAAPAADEYDLEIPGPAAEAVRNPASDDAALGGSVSGSTVLTPDEQLPETASTGGLTDELNDSESAQREPAGHDEEAQTNHGATGSPPARTWALAGMPPEASNPAPSVPDSQSRTSLAVAAASLLLLVGVAAWWRLRSSPGGRPEA
jgi:hypothetical protein